jgi:hypothetical protein
MIEWLLFDRVHGDRRWPAVAKLDQPPTFILADEAEAVLAFSDMAMARA